MRRRFLPNPQNTLERACCEEVLRNNLQSGLTAQDLIDEISEVKRQLNDGWRIVSGHDLCRIAAICSLRRTPDEAQSSGQPPVFSGDNSDAQPGLYTAIQEQLGLKIVPTKAPVEVLVIDHLEPPSAN